MTSALHHCVISNISDEQLSDVRVTWTVCNKIPDLPQCWVLIQFVAHSSFFQSQGVVSAWDYQALSVQGADENVSDRRTPEQMKYDAVSPQENDPCQPSGTSPVQEEGSSDAMFLPELPRGPLDFLVAIFLGINSVLRRGPKGTPSSIRTNQIP